jgi:hypothetical protein
VLERHALIEHYTDRNKQAQWIKGQIEGHPTDGRAELVLGDLHFNNRENATGVDWYLKGIKRAPLDHQLHFSVALCATYAAENLMRVGLPGEAGEADRAKADEFYTLAAEHMWQAIQLDPFEVDFAYDFFIRAVTHSNTVLPASLEDLDRMFRVWAARDGLASSSRTGRLDRVVTPMIGRKRLEARKSAKAAKPGDPDFEMQVMARLYFAVADDSKEEIIESLRLMKHQGLRPDVYGAYMQTYGPLVK